MVSLTGGTVIMPLYSTSSPRSHGGSQLQVPVRGSQTPRFSAWAVYVQSPMDRQAACPRSYPTTDKGQECNDTASHKSSSRSPGVPPSLYWHRGGALLPPGTPSRATLQLSSAEVSTHSLRLLHSVVARIAAQPSMCVATQVAGGEQAPFRRWGSAVRLRS